MSPPITGSAEPTGFPKPHEYDEVTQHVQLSVDPLDTYSLQRQNASIGTWLEQRLLYNPYLGQARHLI